MSDRKIVNEEVLKLFSAIFGRINYNDMQGIMLANFESMRANMNGNTSLQIQKAKEVDAAIKSAIENIIDHDMNTIIKVLNTSDILKITGQ